MRQFLGDQYALYLSSGRAALWLILEALSQIKPSRREVIIPAYTCPAVAAAILKAGLHPILADINLTDFGFSMEDLNEKVTANTLAVIVVHLFGYPAGLDHVYEFLQQHHVFLVEDAAQAFGNKMKDLPQMKLGLLGDAGFFSFGRGKPLNMMHGGVLVTNSEEIYQDAKRIYQGQNHSSRLQDLKYISMLGLYLLFSHPYLYWIPKRIPFLHLGETIFEPDFEISKILRFPKLLLEEMMAFITRDQEIRERNSSWYSEALRDIPYVRKPPAPEFPYLRYPLIVEGGGLRDRILENLKYHGTGAALFYPSPLNELPGLKEILQDKRRYPNSERLSKTLITLPVHGGLRQSDREKIKAIVAKAEESEMGRKISKR
jgi:dTDP-4-amino-4,6-dideoxygalactose transaminase